MERVRVCTAIALLSIACACASPGATGQATPTSSSATLSPAASPAASPEASPSPEAAATLVITPSPDGKHTLVESFADPARPVTLYSLSLNARIVKFISPTEIGYTINSKPDSPVDGVTTIKRMNLTDMKPITVATLLGDALDVTWSPDGTNVAFIIAYPTVPGYLTLNRPWLKVGSASPRALTPLMEFGGREGVPGSDQVIVRFSPDGKYLLMVDTFLAAFQVRTVPEGKLVWSPPATSTGGWNTMAVWSHLTNRLYYRSAGVRTWDAATKAEGTLAAGLTWSSPYVSPDDRLWHTSQAAPMASSAWKCATLCPAPSLCYRGFWEVRSCYRTRR
jgi:hypothetical protein